MFLPFLLQGSEVLLKGRADLAQQLHQWMAQEAGIGWLRVEGVGSRSGGQEHFSQTSFEDYVFVKLMFHKYVTEKGKANKSPIGRV